MIQEKIKSFYNTHQKLSALLILIALPFILMYWYVSIPLLALGYLYIFTKLGKTGLTIGTVVIVLFAAISIGARIDNSKAPVLTITSPENNVSIQTPKVKIEGTVTPSVSKVRIDGNDVYVESNGKFMYSFSAQEEKNTANIVATNNGLTDTKTLNIAREFTAQEKADLAKAKQEAEAKEIAYKASPAGKICTKHPDWSKEDCESIAKREYWIGMNLDMLKEERGTPEHANPSNYGKGVRWQWCWMDYKPSCFYGGEDGIITSYN